MELVARERCRFPPRARGDASMTQEVAAVLPQARFYLHTWQTFFTSRQEPLIRWIMRRCKLQRADAEDCFQDACMKMYQRLETIDGTREQSFHTYLKTV